MNRNEQVLMTDILGGDYIIILFEIKPDGFLRHYKIFCVNGNTGFRNESRIF